MQADTEVHPRMITVNCDRCGVGISRHRAANFEIRGEDIAVTCDLCESCVRLVTTDWRVTLAKWAEAWAA